MIPPISNAAWRSFRNFLFWCGSAEHLFDGVLALISFQIGGKECCNLLNVSTMDGEANVCCMRRVCITWQSLRITPPTLWFSCVFSLFFPAIGSSRCQRGNKMLLLKRLHGLQEDNSFENDISTSVCRKDRVTQKSCQHSQPSLHKFKFIYN